MLKDSDLDFWIKNNLNVLFEGRAGVGKTEIIKKLFTKHFGTRWRYFSASTMDPWTDLVGVPKEQKDADGTVFLDFVRPKEFAKDEVEAVFLDEYNRGSSKAKNATMELLQFKSINGKKYNNLKVVWAAINPVDDKDHHYDVEEMDQAQKDRFQIYVEMPYSVDSKYFKDKYGADEGKIACEWWGRLSKEQKNIVSPRRLDYCLDVFFKGGDISYVLPSQVSPHELISNLSFGDAEKKLAKILSQQDVEGAKDLIKTANQYNIIVPFLKKGKADLLRFILPIMVKETPEKLITLFNEETNIRNVMLSDVKPYESIFTTLASVRGSWAKVAQDALKKIHPNHPDRYIYMTNTVPPHNKYWSCSVEGTIMTSQFGVIGAAPRFHTDNLSSQVRAFKKFDQTVQQKIKKGYVVAKNQSEKGSSSFFLTFEKKFKSEWSSASTYNRTKMMSQYDSIRKTISDDTNTAERIEIVATALRDFQVATVEKNFQWLLDELNRLIAVNKGPKLAQTTYNRLIQKFPNALMVS